MAKYYVQSGSFRSIVTAESPSKAAIWAVHQVMRQIVPTDDDSFTPTSAGESQSPAPMMVLGTRVRIDERGFDRSDARELKTIEVVSLWNEMVLTLDRLQSMMHQ